MMLVLFLRALFLFLIAVCVSVDPVVAQQTTTVSIMIHLGDIPDTFQWFLTDEFRTVASATQGTYSPEQRWGWLVEYVEVNVGTRYELQVQQFSGDGFYGSMELYYGRHNIFEASDENFILRIGEFPYQESHPLVSFVARNPTFIAPTPAPNDNGWPTGAPSRCVEDINYDTANPFEFDKKFSSTNAIFGTDADNTCTSHGNYRDCTNEQGQDCQWIFLTQGSSGGTCRIDPIAACLKNGNCQCNTEDFHGGTSNDVVFHAPISITARDVSPFANRVTYWEQYDFPSNDNQVHPQDDDFFISRVDFTGRRLNYNFQSASPVIVRGQETRTVAFKLHYLYMDVPLVGTIWNGLGLEVGIDTSVATRHRISINGVSYTLATPLKLWTCTQIVITDNTVYVAGVAVGRSASNENNNNSNANSVVLGPFSGQLFDVRVYSGTLPVTRIMEIGARCAARDDPVALRKRDVIDFHFDVHGCNVDADDSYGFQPPDGIQTYGSGPFATLWLGAVEDPFNEGQWLDIPEGQFDVDWYFQQQKMQEYMFERHYFENDMIAFVQEPYRMYAEDQMPDYTKPYYNNPCHFMHQTNNNWDFPLYQCCDAAKWRHEDFSPNDSTAVFDLGDVYNGGIPGYSFILHEMFHFMQFFTSATYEDYGSGWLAESSAEFSIAYQFPGIDTILAGVALAYAWPLGFEEDYEDSDNFRLNPHFYTEELSIDGLVRGGHYYGSWVWWWFLAEQARLPHLLGQMWSIGRSTESYATGQIQLLRMVVESNNLDLGDVYGIFVAHFRTWDFKNGNVWAEKERSDFSYLQRDEPDIFNMDLEERKIAARIDPSRGTNGRFVDGPQNLLPGGFAWNSLTAEGVAAGSVVGISIQWADGMGFASNTFPSHLIDQHRGCDDDVRFYNSMVVLHNERNGERRYWKLKGKSPDTLYIAVGNSGPVTLHLLMIPTPVADYVTGRSTEFNGEMNPRPIYNYSYKVDILGSVPSGSRLTSPASKEFDIVKFDSATPGWWPVECSCLDRPDLQYEGSDLCIQPTFDFGDTSGGGSGGFVPVICFPGSSNVVVENVGAVAMKDVQIGDRVLVQSGKFEPIYSFGHKLEGVEASYLEILPFNLVLSKEHMVIIENGAAVPASALTVGDRLVDGREITEINTVVRRGMYAPFTPSGTIVVDTVLASSFVGFDGASHLFGVLSFQWMAQRFETPHRMWCHYVSDCKNEQYSADGISTWVEVPYGLWRQLLNQNPILILFMMLPVVACFLLMQMLEIVVSLMTEQPICLIALPFLVVMSGYAKLVGGGERRKGIDT